MKVGIFDHLDRSDTPLQQFYEERLEFVAAADASGIASYHLAEHHWNPVGMAPMPGIFLSAIAQRTERIRFGPLAYAVVFHNPLTLAEEICMLDQMSGGRLELGVGRGISPWELALWGMTQPETRDVFHEAMEVMIKCFTEDVVTHRGERWKYYDVPMELKPLQAPYPPLWYGSTSGTSRDWVARHGMHVVAGWAPNARIKQSLDLYLEAWEKTKDDPLRAAAPAMPNLSSVRHVVVAETDAEAEVLAKPARERWHQSLEHLGRRFGFAGMFLPPSYEAARQVESTIAGTPDTVKEVLNRHIAETGINYLLVQIAFGDLPHDATLRSLKMFAEEVMPGLDG